MHKLTFRLSLAAAGLIGLGAVACSLRQTNPAPDTAHGEYIAGHIGMCHDCHSPRNEKGEYVRERWLQGSVLPFQPTVPMPWAPAAPMIAGLPTLTDEQAVSFLMHGELPGGRRPRPPMPEFRFAERDAKDVVAYLRGLAPAKLAAN